MVSRRAWRTRVPKSRRSFAAVVTIAPVVGIGVVVLAVIIIGLSEFGLASWIVALPWAVPTVAAMWLARRAQHGADPEADNVNWVRWSIQRVVTGEGRLAPLPMRLAVAALIGAPVAWGLPILIGIIALLNGL